MQETQLIETTESPNCSDTSSDKYENVSLHEDGITEELFNARDRHFLNEIVGFAYGHGVDGDSLDYDEMELESFESDYENDALSYVVVRTPSSRSRNSMRDADQEPYICNDLVII